MKKSFGAEIRIMRAKVIMSVHTLNLNSNALIIHNYPT